MLPRTLYLFALFCAALELNGAGYSRPGSRVDDGETKPVWVEEKQELLEACQACDAIRAMRILANTQDAAHFSADEQEDLIKTTIGSCGETRSGVDILKGFASFHLASRGPTSFNFNYFSHGLPPIFLASVSAAKSCNLDLVRTLLDAGANPRMPFSKLGFLTNTYSTISTLAKNHDCGPCTRDVLKLFPPEEESPNIDSNFMEQEPMPSESVQITIQMQAGAGAQQESDAGDSQGGSQGDSQGSESDNNGSGGAGWGAFFSDFWKNL